MSKGLQLASNRRPDATSKNLVSATVYLLPDKLKLIKQICADKNRWIRDLISDAIDVYLAKPLAPFPGEH